MTNQTSKPDLDVATVTIIGAGAHSNDLAEFISIFG
jgi:hypothetical protein